MNSPAVNRASWDERVPAHVASPDYAVARFAEDPAFISDVVRFDLPRLGDVGGLRGVHLQCHIGTDTVSLERLGARMTGLDFSGPAVAVSDSDSGTYVETDAVFTENLTHVWNHGLGETVAALLAEGLEITGLAEHDSAPWPALPTMVKDSAGEWRLADRPERLAATFTLQARKRP